MVHGSVASGSLHTSLSWTAHPQAASPGSPQATHVLRALLSEQCGAQVDICVQEGQGAVSPRAAGWHWAQLRGTMGAISIACSRQCWPPHTCLYRCRLLQAAGFQPCGLKSVLLMTWCWKWCQLTKSVEMSKTRIVPDSTVWPGELPAPMKGTDHMSCTPTRASSVGCQMQLRGLAPFFSGGVSFQL